mmetsp:Transcript_6098/g.5246  ORF Transcript_6098/g.5246 Transcript_6098/m.5246 type:complete len:183 (+) Transcript_6098:335-883(+)
MTMKVEENQHKINEAVQQKMRDLHNKGEYDISQSPEEYEKIIQKLEAEVRNHISVQQQMKLYIESYQSKIEEFERHQLKSENLKIVIHKMKKEVNKLTLNNDELNKDKDALKKKIDEKELNYNQKLENLNSKITELQRKLDLKNCGNDGDTGHKSSLSRHDSRNKYFNNKHEMSVDIPESQK